MDKQENQRCLGATYRKAPTRILSTVVGGLFARHNTQQGRKGTDTHFGPGYDQELDVLRAVPALGHDRRKEPVYISESTSRTGNTQLPNPKPKESELLFK